MAEINTVGPPHVTTHGTGVGNVGLSGLTEDDARSFHKMFVTSFLIFLGIAIVAHILVWQWRPWIPGASGYPAVQQTAQVTGQ
ncbi:MAG TPA: light-harvesting antenna LH1, beta subunit [Longimicrobium sp.]|nr:light-harvesting antenna LH1, beta subunit [Longimicrobium sp.]